MTQSTLYARDARLLAIAADAATDLARARELRRLSLVMEGAADAAAAAGEKIGTCLGGCHGSGTYLNGAMQCARCAGTGLELRGEGVA